MQTQQKPENLDESITQTFIMLPLVVAGVVILVKSSLALAFSLAGIMAAVSFRNRLRNPKDAVYIFLASAVGIAVGVRAFDVAFALSLLFNLCVLWLWATDFGGRAYVFAGPLATVRAHRVAIADALSGLHPEAKLSSLTDEYVAQPADQAAVAASAEENGRPPARRPRYVLTIRAPDGSPGESRRRGTGARAAGASLEAHVTAEGIAHLRTAGIRDPASSKGDPAGRGRRPAPTPARGGDRGPPLSLRPDARRHRPDIVARAASPAPATATDDSGISRVFPRRFTPSSEMKMSPLAPMASPSGCACLDGRRR